MNTIFEISFGHSFVPLALTVMFAAGLHEYYNNDGTCYLGPEAVCLKLEQRWPDGQFRISENKQYLRRPAAYRKMCTFNGRYERVKSVCVERLTREMF